MPPNAKSGVYAIVNAVNNERYIGSSTNIGMRWNCHKSDLRKGRHSSLKLQADWNEYSEKVFRLEILELIDEKDQRLHLEQNLIKESKPSYNSRYLPTVRRKTQTFPVKSLDIASLMTEKFHTIRDVAAISHVHYKTARGWIEAKELPALKLGRQRGYRVAQSDLEAFIQRKRTIQGDEQLLEGDKGEQE